MSATPVVSVVVHCDWLLYTAVVWQVLCLFHRDFVELNTRYVVVLHIFPNVFICGTSYLLEQVVAHQA